MLNVTVFAPEDAGIAAVSELRTELLAATEKAKAGSTIVLDLSRVERADSSLAQLIIALKAEAAAKDFSLSIRGDDERSSLRALLSCDSEEDGCSLTRRPARSKTEAKR